MPNEETSQVKRKLLEHAGTSVGDEIAHTMSLEHDPVSYNNAIACLDAKFWKRAMAEELEEFVRKELFMKVGKPKDHCIIGCKWIFKHKLGPNGQVECYKACLVAQGFSQVKDIDYNETYAPITCHSTIWTLLVLAARHQWHIHQMDAKAAFLNGDLSEEIYMKTPSGSDTCNSERGKREFNCDQQVEKGAVTVPNCVLKGSWGEEGSGGIRKKLKYEAQLICNVKIVRMIVGSIQIHLAWCP